jgi:N-glycosylase/DNA lyase
MDRYLRLSLDITKVHQSIDRDPLVHDAIRRFGGTRILDQDPWECLISFICATNANIPVITKRIGLICRRFGEPVPGGGFSFPHAESLARSCESDLRTCSAGYRAGYICRTAQMVAEDPGWADSIREVEYHEARKLLMAYPGVGAKAADCVLLFGFGKNEAFPVDVWMRRVMERYPGAPATGTTLTPSAYARTGEFARGYFGPYAGYAQQYLFMAVREDAAGGVRSRSPSLSGRPTVPS